ncbi:hypothetical protein [Mucilaginibacter boryungensis]|uniref:Uncharacterized protein n=1 Tax=Mucilaginibacter boryungensis TaxID=768480 RepID=A0ABR9XMY3_9SPHI|nr:hypothetical protein [Mucilaginibacter boryungensis]MBE9668717.1 hypothetical protein [Mucilaginibacter boryungensis]
MNINDLVWDMTQSLHDDVPYKIVAIHGDEAVIERTQLLNGMLFVNQSIKLSSLKLIV